jgi:NitT/TauT family transport system substrate-binding protein
VNYLFHGPLGLQTRDQSWKPDYRAAVATALETLKILKRTDSDLDLNAFITDKYVRQAFSASGLNYARPIWLAAARSQGSSQRQADQRFQARRADLADRRSAGAPLRLARSRTEGSRGTGEAGKTARAVYAQDAGSGIKLLAPLAWFVRGGKGEINAFLLKGDAEAWAKAHGGVVLDFTGTKAAVVATN